MRSLRCARDDRMDVSRSDGFGYQRPMAPIDVLADRDLRDRSVPKRSPDWHLSMAFSVAQLNNFIRRRATASGLTTRQARMGLGARLSAVTEKRATGSPGTKCIVGPLRRVVQISAHGMLDVAQALTRRLSRRQSGRSVRCGRESPGCDPHFRHKCRKTARRAQRLWPAASSPPAAARNGHVMSFLHSQNETDGGAAIPAPRVRRNRQTLRENTAAGC